MFSRYLPYAIMFGVAERWTKVFEQLAAQGRYTFDTYWYVGYGYGYGFSAHASRPRWTPWPAPCRARCSTRRRRPAAAPASPAAAVSAAVVAAAGDRLDPRCRLRRLRSRLMTGRLGAWAVPRRAVLLSAVVDGRPGRCDRRSPTSPVGRRARSPSGWAYLAFAPSGPQPATAALAGALAAPAAMAGGGGGRPARATARCGVLRRAVLPPGRTGEPLQDGLLAVVPTVVAVLVAVPVTSSRRRTVGWMLVGGVVVVAGGDPAAPRRSRRRRRADGRPGGTPP